jgi:hypothetical protein
MPGPRERRLVIAKIGFLLAGLCLAAAAASAETFKFVALGADQMHAVEVAVDTDDPAVFTFRPVWSPSR